MTQQESVTQADREAAADWMSTQSYDWGYCGDIRAGRVENDLVAAFAKHRLATVSTTLAEDWQDIATAPKDGTAVLVLHPNGNIGIATFKMVGYDGESSFLSDHHAWSGSRSYSPRVGIWMGGGPATEATHWMPLPPPLSPLNKLGDS